MANPSVAEIMEGLTKAQREMLCAHRPSLGTKDYGWPFPAKDERSFQRSGRGLMDLGLIEWDQDRRVNPVLLRFLPHAR